MRGQIGGPLDELSEHRLPLKESADLRYPAHPPEINGFVARLAQPNYQLAQGWSRKFRKDLVDCADATDAWEEVLDGEVMRFSTDAGHRVFCEDDLVSAIKCRACSHNSKQPAVALQKFIVICSTKIGGIRQHWRAARPSKIDMTRKIRRSSLMKFAEPLPDPLAALRATDRRPVEENPKHRSKEHNM